MADKIPGPAWIPAFIKALAELGQVKAAHKAVGVSQCAVYTQRRTNLRFAEAWTAALPPKPAPEPPPALTRSGGWRTAFLEALAETSNITASSIRANVPLRTVYKQRREDAEFANRWRAALLEGYDHLEIELLGHLRSPTPGRKMDVPSALRLLAAHRESVARERALREDEDEEAVLDSLDVFIDGMRDRRVANTAILIEADRHDSENDDGAQ